MTNLLTEPVFTIRSNDQTQHQLPLGDVFERAVRDDIHSFEALRPHQWQSWHCFLAQLGALALLRAGKSSLPTSADQWAGLLRGLTPEWTDDEPWQLVVDDWQKPAFMQFPTPKGSEAEYKNKLLASDQLDMLVTSKNHDLKIGAARHPTAQDWVFALINLQTTEGFLGAGNYGISRMNGGFSSRCFVGLSPPGGFGAHLSRDIMSLLRCRDEICELHLPTYPTPAAGRPLLWCDTWDGKSGLSMSKLDPYYIDTCRRVRFTKDNDQLVANTATSKTARLDAKALNGNTGDPWAPVSKDDTPKSITLDAGGFHYKRIVDLLYGDWVLPPMCKASTDERTRDMQLVCSAFVRGQGVTEGLHQRRIPLAESVLRGLFGAGRATFGELAKAQIADAAFVQKSLRDAVSIISAGGAGYGNGRIDLKTLKDGHRESAKLATKHFEQYVDTAFFAALNEAWEAQGEQRTEVTRNWKRQLVERARALLYEAEYAVPCPRIHRRRAIAAAHAYFNGVTYHQYDWLRPKPTANPEKESA